MSDGPVFVRPATPLDTRFLGQIHYESLQELGVGEDVTSESLAENWSQAIASAPDARYSVLTAIEEGIVVGFLALAPREEESPEDSGRIEEIIALEIHKNYRRRGHASRLLSAAAEHALAIDAQYLTTWIPADDEARIRFFTSAGFAPAGPQASFLTPKGEVTLHAWAASLAEE